MAIIKSLGIGAGIKSAGNITYRYSRGRTIASQRITENKSNTPLQAAQRGYFRVMSQVAFLLAAHIEWAFDKTKYGSQRNNFIQRNKDYMKEINAASVQQAIVGRIPINTFIPTLFNMGGTKDAPDVQVISAADGGVLMPSAVTLVHANSNAASTFAMNAPTPIDAAKLQLQAVICTSTAYNIVQTGFDENFINTNSDIDGFINFGKERDENGLYTQITFSAGVNIEAGDVILLSLKYNGKPLTVPYVLSKATTPGG